MSVGTNQMKVLSAVCAVAAAIATTPQHAAAQAPDRTALEQLFGEAVTTSATGAPQRVTEAPVNMIILTQEDIRRSGAADLPGVLEQLASIDVMRSFAGQADVSIRGYNTTLAPRLLVLVNGRQVYLDHYGMTNWNALPVQMAEIRQIEVVTGPNTALFGFNAVAGVVNIVTYDALDDDIDAVMLRGGANNYAAAQGVWTARLSERLGARLSVGTFGQDTYANDDAAAAAFFAMPSIDPRATTAALDVAFEARQGLRLFADVSWARSERTERYADAVFPTALETNSVRVGMTADTELGLVSAQAYSNHAEMGFDNRITVASLSLVARPAPAHVVRIAGELRRNELEQERSSLGYEVYSVSVMWNWQATDRLALTTALRNDTLALERDGDLIAGLPFTNADYEQTFSEVSLNAGVIYRASDRDTLRLTAARGVGSPSLLDYGYQFEAPLSATDRIIVAGTPEAAPTIVYDAQLGWDRQLPFLNGLFRATLFWQRTENIRSFAARSEIYSVTPLVLALLPDDIGESEMRGVEFALNGAHESWSWRANYSWRDIDDAVTVPASVNQTAFEETSPEHVFTAGVDWSDDRFELGADARWTGETQQYGRGATLTGLHDVRSHWQLNARAAWRVNETVTLELSGRNLLEPRTAAIGLSPVERAIYFALSAVF